MGILSLNKGLFSFNYPNISFGYLGPTLPSPLSQVLKEQEGYRDIELDAHNASLVEEKVFEA